MEASAWGEFINIRELKKAYEKFIKETKDE